MATAWHYVEEIVALLSARSPKLGTAGPNGTILWTSGAMPGKIRNLTAARV
ncbi:hypothetical protein AB0C84_00725 [Actinomadura sp. NPDC048955]|uniref:hypothetical protein n=1 Tax=Actinomadura sp. NPDC048955 TaxID=3158228 RepID=UPI0033DE2412